ncbi:MAG: AAA family ATPase [Cyanobacterium sp. T60_A2020_053]|nr:AAA family ATPase [Cyanobacterium sp. T60_A2020_053]
MKIISLQLTNFRQFYGKTPIIYFAKDEKNTTIIHGNNGSGKTTILNAFTWAFYQQFTPAFSSPTRLINKKAIHEIDIESSVECAVEIIFEHNYTRYQLKRKFRAIKQGHNNLDQGSITLVIMIADSDGNWKPPQEKPEDIIEKILPRSLHQYFFFDGEQIEHIFRSPERQKIADDTKELIGVKVLERAISHLKKAQKTLQNELLSLGDVRINKLLNEQTQLEKRQEEFNQNYQLLEQRLKELLIEKNNISEKLLTLSGVENLQKLKHNLLDNQEKIKTKLKEDRDKSQKIISNQGYLVFLTERVQIFNNIINELREKGQLPSGIKQDFVQQLLQQNRCICGTELHPNQPPYQQVEGWMNKAGIGDMEESAIRLDTQINSLMKEKESFWQQIDQLQSSMGEGRLNLSHNENEIDKINDQLRQYPDENIQSTQKQLDKIESHIEQINLNKGETNLELENNEKAIENLSKEILKQETKQEKQLLINRRIEATITAINCLEEVKKRLENQFRLALEKRLQEIFSFISVTPYQPRLSENYELNLIENTSGVALPVAASTGENQILSLSFIGAIIDMVRQWSEKNYVMGINSSQFPIVMDSPFGSLDEIYRRQVAKSIPQLANQLIVLVTKTQWRNEVEMEMSDYINRQYILVYRSPKPDCQEDSININNREYPLVTKIDSQYEYTEIIEIEN